MLATAMKTIPTAATTRSLQVSGSMTLERKINTQIPDEDQAIQW